MCQCNRTCCIGGSDKFQRKTWDAACSSEESRVLWWVLMSGVWKRDMVVGDKLWADQGLRNRVFIILPYLYKSNHIKVNRKCERIKFYKERSDKHTPPVIDDGYLNVTCRLRPLCYLGSSPEPPPQHFLITRPLVLLLPLCLVEYSTRPHTDISAHSTSGSTWANSTTYTAPRVRWPSFSEPSSGTPEEQL